MTTEHCDPGWKIAGGGLATKIPLWKLYFEDSIKKDITLNHYKNIRTKTKTKKLIQS